MARSTLVCRLPVPGAPAPDYWDAGTFAASVLADFETARRDGDLDGMRRRFFLLARYQGRTIGILRSALRSGSTDLILRSLENLVVLHRHLARMRSDAPRAVPLVLTLDRASRRRVLPDLVMGVLEDAAGPLALDTVIERTNDLHVMALARTPVVAAVIKDLVAGDYLRATPDGRFQVTRRVYRRLNTDREGLRALLGDRLYREFDQGGFSGLSPIRSRVPAFQEFFARFAGCGPAMADRFVAVATELTGPPTERTPLDTWPRFDLIGSSVPRPYQREAFEVFRDAGYRGQVIEAPTGSGKTLVGMMCIQDWLDTIAPGETVLVLVPTANYVQQWIGELTSSAIGLRLPIDAVHAGTPAELEADCHRPGARPAVLVMTYASLASIGSGVGKGGFDVNSIEALLQGNGVLYVLLDEVHKVAEDERSVTANVVRVFLDWLEDGSLRGVIGFSGTAEGHRKHLAHLGLDLAFTVPPVDLIARGFLAPYAEFGIPFAYSDRERRIVELVTAYRDGLARYLRLLGPDWTRGTFAGIPPAERLAIARDVLGLAAGRTDRDEALARRFERWERDGGTGVSAAPMLSIVQVALDLSDEATVTAAGGDAEASFSPLLGTFERIREELAGLVRDERTAARLAAEEFATLRMGDARTVEGPGRAVRVRDLLSRSIAGLYPVLRGLYQRMGEGRVDTIRAVLRAEATAREVPAAIVFDRAARIRWKESLPAPGYGGVGGLFAELLGVHGMTPIAVISGELYLPMDGEPPPHARIAAHVREVVMLEGMGRTLLALVTRGLDLPGEVSSGLAEDLDRRLRNYMAGMTGVRASRPAEFGRKVLGPLRRRVRRAHLGLMGDRLLERLSPKHHHVRRWIETFFDYALVARRFDDGREGRLRRSDGNECAYCVVRMTGGERRAFFYDLVARVVDGQVFPVDVVIVSSWARTGWNVHRPNVLIDATATRDPTAWLQLRGRAMRPKATWTGDASERLIRLVAGMDGDAPIEKREAEACRLLLEENKVTHIHELVKAYGSGIQVVRDRRTGTWGRVPSIAAKHALEVSVDPVTGAYGPGEKHAPLVGVDDPRENRPVELERRLGTLLKERDATIVQGWLRAAGMGR
ncbi:MAG: DEAD/DEAH box helicase [Methanoregulaceae archaeon]